MSPDRQQGGARPPWTVSTGTAEKRTTSLRDAAQQRAAEARAAVGSDHHGVGAERRDRAYDLIHPTSSVEDGGTLTSDASTLAWVARMEGRATRTSPRGHRSVAAGARRRARGSDEPTLRLPELLCEAVSSVRDAIGGPGAPKQGSEDARARRSP